MYEILVIINQLLESGEAGEQALRTLEQIPEWNQLVERAVDSDISDW
jgi:hypothetical protein